MSRVLKRSGSLSCRKRSLGRRYRLVYIRVRCRLRSSVFSDALTKKKGQLRPSYYYYRLLAAVRPDSLAPTCKHGRDRGDARRLRAYLSPVATRVITSQRQRTDESVEAGHRLEQMWTE